MKYPITQAYNHVINHQPSLLFLLFFFSKNKINKETQDSSNMLETWENGTEKGTTIIRVKQSNFSNILIHHNELELIEKSRRNWFIDTLKPKNNILSTHWINFNFYIIKSQKINMEFGKCTNHMIIDLASLLTKFVPHTALTKHSSIMLPQIIHKNNKEGSRNINRNSPAFLPSLIFPLFSFLFFLSSSTM